MRLLLIAAVLVLAWAKPADACAPRCTGKKITVDLQHAEIGNVLRLLADVSGHNFVYGDEVKGKVTLKLREVPWDQALDVVLKTKGLGMKKDGNVIRVAALDVLRAEEMAALDLAAQRELKGPLTTRVIPVNYAPAKELAAHLKLLLSPRGTVSVDERTNTIIVRDVRGSPALSAQ
ncbi:MAG: secretin and TonB N-terminal domain-containing protein [Deltaproteobacteria bacterium]|nr:secretin and TonB N-terminal domain-containing protein [Deltaproteobacteria bacterium]